MCDRKVRQLQRMLEDNKDQSTRTYNHLIRNSREKSEIWERARSSKEIKENFPVLKKDKMLWTERAH